MPQISIIIPTFNRALALAKCLESLHLQVEVPGEFEVIVVDDGSTDNTRQVCEDWPGVKFVRQANQGAAVARNHGAQVAQAEWIAFLDDDCRPRPTWLANLWRMGGENEAVLTAGTMVNALTKSPFAEATQALLDYVYSFYNGSTGEARFVAGSNFLLSRERLLAMDGFDPGYHQMGAEDRDFCARWLHSGGRIRVAAEAVVDHAHVMGWRGFCQQHYNYGRGAWLFHRQAAEGKTGRGMEKPGYYWHMLTHPLGSPGGLPGLRLSSLIVLSQVMSTFGYATEALIHRRG